jgi:hypothetical protein
MKNPDDNNSQEGYENKEAENRAKGTRITREERLDDSLRDQGLDKEHAAGIANTENANIHNIGKGNGKAHVFEAMSMEELYEAAKAKGINGYYDMRRTDIVMALKQTRTED